MNLWILVTIQCVVGQAMPICVNYYNEPQYKSREACEADQSKFKSLSVCVKASDKIEKEEGLR